MFISNETQIKALSLKRGNKNSAEELTMAGKDHLPQLSASFLGLIKISYIVSNSFIYDTYLFLQSKIYLFEIAAYLWNLFMIG